MSIQHILLGTDFSEPALEARRLACRLAARWGARLTLVHVYDPMPLGAGTSYPAAVWTGADMTAQLAREAERLLAAERSALTEVSDVTTSAVPHGSAAEALCKEAEERKADLVVVGTHGRTGFTHLLLGSVAEKVVRRAPCSVLAVRQAAESLRHVLCATDFTPSSAAAVEQSAFLARSLDARVTLFHAYVVEPPIAPWLEGVKPFTAVDAELRSALKQRYERILPESDIHLATSPSAAHAIVAHAADEGCDLVVVGTHGRTGLTRVLIGSVAEKVVRHAPVNVWVARSEAQQP
jgi:nucleotide-binding universal stress UspA family protein